MQQQKRKRRIVMMRIRMKIVPHSYVDADSNLIKKKKKREKKKKKVGHLVEKE